MNIIMGGDMEYEDLIGLTEFLKWKNVTTKRQKKNGTQIWELPIKIYGQFMKVGSFKRGYVRRMNGCYTPYQLNKCEPNIEYYKDYDHFQDQNGNWRQEPNGKYNKFVGKRRILIEDKRDRLEYLIDYCLKNYYINQANQVENGEFVHKWQHEYEMKNGNIDRIRELQAENRELKEEIDDRGALDNLSVIVNNERYKII